MSPSRPACWLAAYGRGERGRKPGPCEGRMQKAHLIKQQVLRREGLWERRWEPAVWVWACERHHYMFDKARTLRVARLSLPEEFEDWAQREDLEWYLDRTFGLYAVRRLG